MAPLQAPQTGGDEQTDQDVLRRIRQAYAEKKQTALETSADKANRERRPDVGGRQAAEDQRQRQRPLCQ